MWVCCPMALGTKDHVLQSAVLNHESTNLFALNEFRVGEEGDVEDVEFRCGSNGRDHSQASNIKHLCLNI